MARETRKRKQPKRKDQERTRPEGGEGQRQEGGEKGKDEPAPLEEDAGC